MKRKILLVAISLLYFSTSAQEIPQLETYTLKNGLKIYLLQYGKIPAINVRFITNTGKKNETPAQQGYSEITASMLLKGNKKYTEEAQNDLAFKLGGELNSNSTFDNTTINANFLAKDFDTSMDLFSSAIISPLLDKDKLDQQISYLIDYNNPAKMDIVDLADVYSDLNLYGIANPLGRHYYKAQLQLITPEKIKEYYQFNFTPKNSSIVVCGNFNAAEIKISIEKYFGTWQSAYSEVNGVALDEPSIKKKEISFVNRTGATQCALQWNKIAPSLKSKDYLAFRIANAIFNRVLFSEIREKGGKTYGISSNYKASRFSNVIAVTCSVRNDEVVNTINLFDKTLQNFSISPVLQADFNKAVLSLRTNIISFEMPENVASFYNPTIYDFQTRKNFLTDLNALKIADVQKVVKKYFTANSYKLIIAGDEMAVDTQLSKLKDLVKYKASDIEKDN